MIEINRTPSARELRQFGGIWLPVFLLLVAGMLVRRWHLPTAAIVPAFLAVVSILTALAAPTRLKPVFVGMMVATYPVGWVVSHVILAVIYFVVITPIGLVRRRFFGDPLQRRFDAAATSYWVPRPPDGTLNRYFRQF